MSNSLAIAAVTSTVRNFLDAVQTDLPGTVVTAQPLNSARRDETRPNQLNLFLYQVMPNTGWRNQDLPSTRSSETGSPPLALDLYYLLTAFGLNDDDALGHQLLGQAMSILHDHPVLNRNSIRDALAGNDLHEQIERIRITHEPISMDDLFKMWTTFQTEYRISVAYKATVVLINSQRPLRAPVPVLNFNLTAQGNLLSPYPTITNIRLPNNAPAIRLGETLSIQGHHLSGDEVTVLFETEHFSEALSLTPSANATETNIDITLPNDNEAQTNWVAGLYRVKVQVVNGNDIRETGTFGLSIAPRITSLSPNPISLSSSNPLIVETQPQIQSNQQPQLLLGSQPLIPQSIVNQQLSFDLTNLDEARYLCRLRVDGVDSHLVDYSANPPVFDPALELEVTA